MSYGLIRVAFSLRAYLVFLFFFSSATTSIVRDKSQGLARIKKPATFY